MIIHSIETVNYKATKHAYLLELLEESAMIEYKICLSFIGKNYSIIFIPLRCKHSVIVRKVVKMKVRATTNKASLFQGKCILHKVFLRVEHRVIDFTLFLFRHFLDFNAVSH